MASVAKRANGKWEVRYKDKGGSHRSKTFTMKKDADSYSRKIEIDLERGLHIAPGASIKVEALAEEYIASLDQRVAAKSITKAYGLAARLIIRKHHLPKIGNVVVSELTRAHLNEVAKFVFTEQGLSPAYARHAMKFLSLMLDFGVRREYLTINQLPIVMKDYRSGGRPVVRTFQKQDVRALLTALETTPESKKNGGSRARSTALVRCAVFLAAFCGLRIGEILALSWENLDMEERVIRVRHSRSFQDGLKGPKTKAGIRDVPMPEIVVAALQAWATFAPLKSGYAFTGRFGGPIDYTSFHESCWRPLLERAGLGAPDEHGKSYHFHALRHFASSMMIDMNLPLPEVASLMGHNKFDMTLQVYAHTIVGGHRRHAAIEGAVQSLAEVAPKVSCAGVTQQH